MKKLLLTTLFLTIACDSGEMKVEACKTAFEEQLGCHQSKIQESCWAICDEIAGECMVEDPTTDACAVVNSSCREKCYDFQPKDPTRFGTYPERTVAFYMLESCQAPEDRDLICS